MKTTHATIRIKASDHDLSLSISFPAESSLSDKFWQILETINDKGYLNGSRLESIFFFESEEL